MRLFFNTSIQIVVSDWLCIWFGSKRDAYCRLVNYSYIRLFCALCWIIALWRASCATKRWHSGTDVLFRNFFRSQWIFLLCCIFLLIFTSPKCLSLFIRWANQVWASIGASASPWLTESWCIIVIMLNMFRSFVIFLTNWRHFWSRRFVNRNMLFLLLSRCRLPLSVLSMPGGVLLLIQKWSNLR